MYSFSEVQNYDPDLAKAMADETQRQRDNIELIASENLVSKAVMAAMGSTLTNKYAEGYPGKRYYGGCEHVDVVEDLARDRAMKLFGCTYANVQPHSGASNHSRVSRRLGISFPNLPTFSLIHPLQPQHRSHCPQ